jgi:hypothetical protein
VPAFSDDDLTIVLSRVVDCLRRGSISYVVIGAWALSLWGKPRATADLDFLVLVKEEEWERLGALMTPAGMEIDEAWQKWNPLLRGSQLSFNTEESRSISCGHVIHMTRRFFDGGGRGV